MPLPRSLARASLALAVIAVATHAAPASAQPSAVPGPPDVLADQPPLDADALALRHGQLGQHQGFGLATLVSMAVTGGLGYWYADLNGPAEMRDVHLASAGLTTGLYLTTATLALTAPPNPFVTGPGPWDTVTWHRTGAWLHGAGMLGTVGLGLATVYGGSAFAPYHGTAAAVTFGLMALSAGVIAFGE